MEIATNRFLLRDFEVRDRSQFIAWHNDPRFQAHYGPEVAVSGHPEKLLDTFITWASENPRRNYQLAISLRLKPNEVLGCCGLRTAGCEAKSAELGIELAPKYWGKYAYATEVVAALLDFGFRTLGLQEIHGVTSSNNSQVIRLAKWFGAEAMDAAIANDWMLARGWSQTAWKITRERWTKKTNMG